MNSTDRSRESRNFLFVLGLIFFSRLPFLLPGFGSEEDAWGLFYIARKVAQTGVYEVSRLPGHPFQEMIYLLLWKQGALAFNLLTAGFSTAAAGFFMAALRKHGVPNPLLAGLVFSFIPVVYINSCNAMDYMWATAFLMSAFYFLAGRRVFLAGVCTGLAAGCRITSLAMLLPFFFLVYDPKDRGAGLKAFFSLAWSSTAVALIVFIPVLATYGLSFFDYTAQVPVPLAKAAYLSTLGVWGVIGFLDLLFALVLLWRLMNRTRAKAAYMHGRLLRCGIAAIVVYGFAFVVLPQKAAFLIPALPFFIAILAMYLDRTYLGAFAFSMIFSSFFIGLNLDDPDRGAGGSAWSYSLEIAGRPLVLDLARGPMMADRAKRRNKIDFSNRVIVTLKNLRHRSVVIAGFWSSDILAKMDSLPASLRIVYYVPEDSLIRYSLQGDSIYYLPEQARYNDLAHHGLFTRHYARPLLNE